MITMLVLVGGYCGYAGVCINVCIVCCYACLCVCISCTCVCIVCMHRCRYVRMCALMCILCVCIPHLHACVYELLCVCACVARSTGSSKNATTEHYSATVHTGWLVWSLYSYYRDHRQSEKLVRGGE